VGEIGSSGVAPTAATPGAYEILLRRALAWYCENDYRWIVLRSEARDPVVQQVWAGLGGFAPRRQALRFHWWLH
jgi:hypothetical protein